MKYFIGGNASLTSNLSGVRALGVYGRAMWVQWFKVIIFSLQNRMLL